jgi:PAS domain S-box-containing protein
MTDTLVKKMLNNPQRLAALHRLKLLDTDAEAAFDRLAQLAARAVHAPVVLVSLVDNERQFFKSCLGLPEPWLSWRETPLSHSFCQHVVATSEPLVVNDARVDPRLSDNLAIRDLNAIAYLGSPLILPGGEVIGSFCVIDTMPRDWNEAEIAIVRDLAASVMSEIELRHMRNNLEKLVQEQAMSMSDSLRESELRARIVSDSSPVGIFMAAPDGHVIYDNVAIRRTLGLEPNEILLERWAEAVHPDDRERVFTAWSQFVSSKRPDYNEEFRFVLPDLSVRLVHARATRILDGERLLGFAGTAEDITERRQAEKLRETAFMQQRAIINASPVPMALNDDQQNITFLNPVFTQTFGYTREDIPTLAAWWPKAYPDPEYRKWVAEIWQATLEKSRREGTVFPPIEFNIRCKNGTVKTALVNAAPIGESFEGNHLVVLYDITERKFAEAERERLLTELTARNIEMENFVYTISHDLKTPLVTIGGFASLLDKDLARGDSAAVTESLTEINKAAAQLQKNINDLLLLSRTGRAAGAIYPVALTEIVKDVLRQFNKRLKEADAKLVVAPDLPIIEADRQGFARVYTNLIDNALKYHRPGAPLTIEIGWENNDQELRFFVRDNGQGIKQQFHARIFDMFQRADSKTEGAGVGLAISKRVIDVHGGRMWVESEPGQGSTFWMALPATIRVE